MDGVMIVVVWMIAFILLYAVYLKAKFLFR